ncbi:MAG: L-threonylcarbamoyladenylate synthase [Cyanobacteria bacterium P01_C01_bin.118]
MPYVGLEDYIKAVRSGGVLALPTDTVWGVATMPKYSSTLYELKQRSLDKALILLGANADDLWPYVTMDVNAWQAITEKHWPGQLTLVLPSTAQVPMEMHPKTPDTIGVRVPNHPVAQQLLALTGPLATTSANVSGQPNLMSVKAVLDQFPQVYGLDKDTIQKLLEDLGTDGELPAPSGLPSTVARWQLTHWEVLRQGTVYL